MKNPKVEKAIGEIVVLIVVAAIIYLAFHAVFMGGAPDWESPSSRSFRGGDGIRKEVDHGR